MQDFVNWAKNLNWQKIHNVCDSLNDLNDSQYRFLKGRVIELLIENFSNGVLTFVGEKHKDFNCDKFNCTIELKSEISNTLYTKKGLRSTFGVRFNNSMGTNKSSLDPAHVADYVIIVKKDGSVLVDKSTVLKNVKSHGDGFSLILKPNDVVELSGKITTTEKFDINLKKHVDNLITETISNLSKV